MPKKKNSGISRIQGTRHFLCPMLIQIQTLQPVVQKKRVAPWATGYNNTHAKNPFR